MTGPIASVAARPRESAVGTVLILAAVAFASLRFLSLEWSVNPQYTFGWGVPVLAAYLFWKRWLDRPAPSAPRQTIDFFAAGVVLALVALPLRILLEANPDWRLLLWTDALIFVFAALLAIAFAGGRPWLKHFFLPAVFILLAAPWPTRAEKLIVETFTHDISGATVEAMNWLGIPAVLHGNLIELRSATLGVSEACSGIRSFQTTLMAAVFFGELYRLGFLPRLALVPIALAWGIVLNFFRTTLLTWIAATRSSDTEASLHDAIGLGALVVVIAGIMGMSILLARKRQSLQMKDGRPNTEKPDISAQVPDSRPSTASPRFFSWRTIVLIAVWLVAVEAFNEIWYRSREPKPTSEVAWTVSMPAAAQGFVPQKLSDEVLTLLRCDRSETGVWKRPDGSEWTMFFIKWRAGRMAAQLARGHTPDVCMTGSGFTMVAETGPAVFSLPPTGAQLPFESYVFKADGRPWYVFFCLRESRVVARASLVKAREEYLSELAPGSRIRAALDGRRFYGQQVFEIAMAGYDSLEQARSALERALPQLVKMTENK